MRENLKKYPEESLRQQLEKCGLPRDRHDLESLKVLVAACFKHAYHKMGKSLSDADTSAEILIYLHNKEIFSLDGYVDYFS